MLIRRPDDIAPSDITPRSLFDRRREFLRLSSGAALAGLFPAAAQARLGPGQPSVLSTTETPTPLKHVAGYNNYYEFGTDKEDPARVGVMVVSGWGSPSCAASWSSTTER